MNDDAQLLRAWGDGDDRAGATLYRRHFDALYRFFRTKAPDDYEDLIQTTMLECVQTKSNESRGILNTDNTENAAFFAQFVVVKRVGRDRHGLRIGTAAILCHI